MINMPIKYYYFLFIKTSFQMITTWKQLWGLIDITSHMYGKEPQRFSWKSRNSQTSLRAQMMSFIHPGLLQQHGACQPALGRAPSSAKQGSFATEWNRWEELLFWNVFFKSHSTVLLIQESLSAKMKRQTWRRWRFQSPKTKCPFVGRVW